MEAVDCKLGWLVALAMADDIETMYCEIAFRLDGGDLDFLCVWCVCVCVFVCVFV